MGKKYVPVMTGGTIYKLYLDDLLRIQRTFKKQQKPIPSYSEAIILRKTSRQTSADFDPLISQDLEQDSFTI